MQFNSFRCFLIAKFYRGTMHMCAGLIKVVSVCKEAILLIKGKTSDSIVRLCWNKSGVAFTAKLESNYSQVSMRGGRILGLIAG